MAHDGFGFGEEPMNHAPGAWFDSIDSVPQGGMLTRMGRFDGGQFLARQLEILLPKIVEIKSPNLCWLEGAIPVAAGEGAGASSITWREEHASAQFEPIGDATDELKQAQTSMQPRTLPVHLFGAGFGWTVQEMAAAERAGEDLNARKAQAITRAYQERVERIALLGMADLGIQGLIQRSSVTAANALSAASTVAQILGVFGSLLDGMADDSGGTEEATVVIISDVQYRYLRRTPVGTENRGSILDEIEDRWGVKLKPSRMLREVATASSGLTAVANFAIALNAVPDALELHIPAPLQFQDPEQRGLRWLVASWAEIAGVSVYRGHAARAIHGL
jgi:hypothetical protein